MEVLQLSMFSQSHKREDWSMNKVRFVGLDVHKETIVIAVADEGRDAPQVLGTIRHDVVQLIKQLSKLAKDKSQLRVCYEAGPTGFGLFRRLNAAGITCRVVAPSLIPQQVNLRVKTDRRDACRLAQFLRSGDLTEVWVPDEKTESLRDLERARDDAKNAERVARHQLSKFLLRNDRVFDGGRAWTVAHARWLKQQKFDEPCKQLVMNDYCKAVAEATERVRRLTEDLTLSIRDMPLEPLVRALMSFYGINLISAVIIAAELGDLRRFKSAKQLMAFLGLVPSEHSTGKTVRRGSITKTGNMHVRRILVEAVQHYRRAPSRSKVVEQRRKGVSEEVVAITRKAERRLYQRMNHLIARNKPWNKMVIALARELAGFIWAVGQAPSFLAPTKVGTLVEQTSAKTRKKSGKERGPTTRAQQQQG
jgi:transposase